MSAVGPDLAREVARRRTLAIISHRNAYLEAGFVQHFGCRIGVFLAQVGEVPASLR